MILYIVCFVLFCSVVLRFSLDQIFLMFVSLFRIQMLGSYPVFKAQGSGCTDEAVHQIVANTKKVCVGAKGVLRSSCFVNNIYLTGDRLWMSHSLVLFPRLRRSPGGDGVLLGIFGRGVRKP